MKQILLLFTAVLFIGCSSESEPETLNPNVEFTGTWRQVAITPEGETELIDVTNCETHPEAKKYVFDVVDPRGCYIRSACGQEGQINTIFNVIDGFVYLTYADPDLENLQEKYTLTVFSETKVGIKEVWNSYDGDIANGQYIVIEKQ